MPIKFSLDVFFNLSGARGWSSGGSRPFCEVQARRGGGVLPYISYISMCRPKGYGFRAVLV